MTGSVYYGGVGTQESGESTWLGGGDVESQVEGTQGSGESPWFGGGPDEEAQELLNMSV